MTTVLEQERSFLQDVLHRAAKRRRLNDLEVPDVQLSPLEDDVSCVTTPAPKSILPLKPVQRRKALAYGPAYVPSEETLRTNLSQECVNSRRLPQNFLVNTELETRFDEYPKLKRLLELHSELVRDHAIPPTFLDADPRSFDLVSLLPTRFDCIVIDPPADMSWEEVALLPVPSIAATPSFIWIWCGAGDDGGLEKGRALLAKWGYRRCEDIVWLKTNKGQAGDDSTSDNLFTQSKEHCLQGIRGTVRRSTDADFVHCNVDIDVIVWEPDAEDARAKPPELHSIIENFCLGTRRLHLFGSKKDLRRGWLTMGSELRDANAEAATQYQKEDFDAAFTHRASQLVPNTPEVDALRPKSPPGRGGASHQANSGGGIGRGRGTFTPRPAYPPPQPQNVMPGNFQAPFPMFNPMAFNPMAMMNPAMMGGAMDWTSFFQNQQG